MIGNVFANAMRGVDAAPELNRLKKATNDFQTAFVKQLVGEMRKASKSEFGDVPGSSVYDDMTNQILAEKLSSNGGFGIGQTMYKQLAKVAYAQMGEAPSVKQP